jgi:protein-disulfide isomerase
VDQVLQAYPKDVNFVFKNYPLPMHPNADPAARSVLAAGKQGKFWEMHDELFKNFRTLSPETIKGTAEKIGLDVKKFEADMNSDEIKQQVQREMKEGQNAMVRGTPSFFINGKVAQNRSLEGFKAQIDEELKKKKAG